MANFCLMIQYDGTRYNGWQRQGNTADTIQGKLEAILLQLYGEPVDLNGSGVPMPVCMHCARLPITVSHEC